MPGTSWRRSGGPPLWLAVQSGHGDSALRDLGLRAADPAASLGLPAAWRVVGAFLLVAALAVLVVWLMRRWQRPGLRGTSSPEDLRVVASRNVSAGGRVHVVEHAGQRYLIVESRAGVGICAAAAHVADVREPGASS